MIKKIIRFSVYHPALVLVASLLAALAGRMAFESLPIDAVPDITNIQVQVNTVSAGLAPEEIERSVTFPLETALGGIAGVTQVRSITRFGLSQVTVVFEDGTDTFRARQLVAERLQAAQAELPPVARPQMGPITTGLGEVYHYVVEAETIKNGEERVRQLMELRSLQEWTIRPRLLTVKGVAEVNAIGGFEKQFHVQPKPGMMARYGLHFSDLKEALERTNQNVGGGYVQQTAEQFLVQAVGLLRTIEEVREVPVRQLETFRTLTIGDIAEVGLAKELRRGAALVSGREAVVGTALMLMGENSRQVAQRVEERLGEIRSALPPGYKIETLYSRSDLVNATLDTVTHNLLTGALLVIVVLMVLVGNLRAALITALTIPLTLLMTFVAMRYLGISGNLMSLGALDFGIIVDGVVIILDNCVRVLHERSRTVGRALTRDERRRAIYDATVEIRSAAGFGELIIVVVFLPIFSLVGIEGRMFVPMALTFSIAVGAALVLAFTTAPAIASAFLVGKVNEHEPWVMRSFRRGYGKLLALSMRYRQVTVGLGVVAAVVGAILFGRLGGEFLPQLDEGSFIFQFVRPVNVSLDQSVALQEKSEAMLAEFGEVSKVFSRLGTGEIATDPMGVNFSDTFVILKAREAWPEVNGHRRDKSELARAILERLEAELPGQRTLVSQPIQMRFNDLLEGTRADISVKVFGEDMDVLARITREVAAIIQNVPGAGDVEVELRGKSPLLKVVPKPGILKKLGVSNREILETVGVALGGEEAGHLYDGVKRYPLVIRLSEKDRSDLEAIEQLPVGIQGNATIPLRDVATIGFTETYATLVREQTKRRAAVLINLRGRDTESFIDEAKQQVTKKLRPPAGYYLEWGGNFRNLQEASARLRILTPITLLLVLTMIYAAFQSVPQTLLVFSGVPMALVGGVLGLAANGLPFSIAAGVGFIALIGIAVLNGVVLMNYLNELRRQGLSGRALVEKATLVRLRPVLMTAFVDIFGFLPMMLSHGVGAEVQRPLAAVVIGGVFSSTLLTLIVLPAAYSLLEKYLAPAGQTGDR